MSEPLLAVYDFVAHYRRGAAADLDQPDPLSGPLPARGPLHANFTLRATAGDQVDNRSGFAPVELYGPGDVLGVDPRHVIKTEPRDRTMNYEPNYFAGIEFDHPEFPWLFTPAAPNGDRLRPWVALVALVDGAEWKPADSGGPLPAIEVTTPDALPNLDQSWAWAHAQVSGGIGASTVERIQIDAPQRALSRLLCPRRLKPLTPYTAFLVPAFDAGRQAGLGLPAPPGDKVAPAWPDPAGVTLPVYYRFSFHTSEEGDFESLVRALKPRRLPKEVGIRDMDVDRPGWGLPSAGTPLGLAGALRSVETQETVWSGPDREAFQAALTEHVNRGAAPVTTAPGSPDPVVEPPLYGRWHAAVASVDPAAPGWIDELSTDPRRRATAGFGTRVVVAERAQLMHAAWQQVDGVLKANQLVRQGQLALAASQAVLAKHLAPADTATVLALTEPLHTRLLASPRTVAATLAGSSLPAGALWPTFRRLARPRGPIARRQGGARPFGRLIERLAAGEITPEPPYLGPKGMIGLGQSASGIPGAQPGGWLAQLSPLQALLLALLLALLALIAMLLIDGVLLAVLVAMAVGIAVWLIAAWARKKHPGGELEGSAPDAVGGGLSFGDLSPDGFGQAPPHPGFEVVGEGVAVPATNWPPGQPPGAADSADGGAFRGAGERLGEYLQAPRPEQPKRPRPPLAQLGPTLLERLDPGLTIPHRIGSLIAIDDGLAIVVWDPERFDEIMAAPEFPQPMYEPLRDLSQELLLPGLELIPENTLGLLAENHAFVESYMVGLNHEMARQLLWNNYRTDQRGSYFRQFWDVRTYVPGPGDPSDPDKLRELLKDVPPVHRWPTWRPLGENRNRPHSGGDNLILLVRGDLLRRYPNTVVYACEAVWNETTHQHDIPDPEVHRNPMFRGTLSPDITFFGFDLTKGEALGDPHDHSKPQGWFFVFQEQPSEPRFGLEPAPEPFAHPAVSEWNDLTWANLAADAAAFAKLEHASPAPLFGSVTPKLNPDGENPGDPDNHWGTDAAQMAFITMRRPVRVAVHAETMLPKEAG